MGRSGCKGSKARCSHPSSAPSILQTQFPPCNKANAIQGILALQGFGPQEKDTDEMP